MEWKWEWKSFLAVATTDAIETRKLAAISSPVPWDDDPGIFYHFHMYPTVKLVRIPSYMKYIYTIPVSTSTGDENLRPLPPPPHQQSVSKAEERNLSLSRKWVP